MEENNNLGNFSYHWETEPTSYKHFTDMGNYLLVQKDLDFADNKIALDIIRDTNDPFVPRCTCTAKLNKKGEVIMGRNMDVEISQTPAIITRIKGGKHTAISFYYGGVNARYRYDELDKLDADPGYLLKCAYAGTDAMNETGLYIEVNMREMDEQVKPYCSGTNPGKPRACLLSAPVLICANCATVPEALAYLKDSFDWFTLGFFDHHSGGNLLWNLALMIGDAQGNFGLVEFASNHIFYTPYANGQGNYYIHPQIAEYSDRGTGYGRFAAALEGLPACETDWDMLHNMESCMWRREILDPGCLGYSDIETSLLVRRAVSQEILQKVMDAKMKPLQAAAKEFYNGNEKPLRDDGSVWTTGFNFGVNCAEKHLILRLWEKDSAIVELQW